MSAKYLKSVHSLTSLDYSHGCTSMPSMQWPASEAWHLAHKGSIRLLSQSTYEPNHVYTASAKGNSDPAIRLR